MQWQEEDKRRAGFLARPLLEWYGKNARDLPWRRDVSPYRVWVSEIMLQQTRVEAVIPYYERFLRRLPDVTALAQAPEETLHKLWEGLGYYSRVRNLQKAARQVVEQYGGRIPGSYEEPLKLAGIGDYTAGAIASIAFGLRVPAVDGNVLRVFSRLTDCREDVTVPAVKTAFRQLVESSLPEERVGDYNQSLMELGATVCLPNGEPACLFCPVRELCLGFARGTYRELPVKPPKKERRGEKKTMLLLAGPAGVLLEKRPDRGLLAGLWGFPELEGWHEKEELCRLLKGEGISFSSCRRAGESRHVFTHREWDMETWIVKDAAVPEEAFAPHVWASREDLANRYALPSAYGGSMKALMDFWKEENPWRNG